MKKQLVSFVKYNKVLLRLYRFCGNAFVAVLKLLVRVKPKRILFMSFGGQKYDDSPKVIYERIIHDGFFRDYEFIWGFTDPAAHEVSCKKVKVDSFRFYITAISSHIWINNSSVERGLSLKRKDCIEINTWHGTPLKKAGDDIEHNYSYSDTGTAKKGSLPTIYCAQSEYNREIFVRFFHTSKEQIILSDLPRNDTLFEYDSVRISKLKAKLNIPADKKVILYAPTFREYLRDKFNACYIRPPIDLNKWRAKLGEKYVLLFRAHYEVINILGIGEDNDFIRNVSSYPCLNDLIALSDLLISDYSSIYVDYSITEKPMFSFVYDLEEYQEKRGLYIDLNSVMPCRINHDEDSLIDELLSFDYSGYCEKTRLFKEKFAPYAGNATEKVLDALKKQIENGSVGIRDET